MHLGMDCCSACQESIYSPREGKLATASVKEQGLEYLPGTGGVNQSTPTVVY